MATVRPEARNLKHGKTLAVGMKQKQEPQTHCFAEHQVMVIGCSWVRQTHG